jgi:hypothetical protein
MSNPWTFSESRPIPPYRMSPTALAAVGFRSGGHVIFNDADPFHLVLDQKDIRSSGFSPELSLAVDKDRLASDSGIEQDDLALSVLMADPGMLKAMKVAQWPLLSSPAIYAIPKDVLAKVSAVRGITLRVCASPRKALKASAGRATGIGQIVAAKDFTIDVPSDAAGFPIETHPSEVFVQHHYPADTVWVIRWKTGSDFDRPIEECLSVWFNSDHAARLMRLAPSDKLGHVLWNEIAVEICLEIALVVLGSGPTQPANQTGLLAKIVSKLQSGPAMSVADLARKARADRDGMGFFRSRLQAALGQGKKILAVPLAGRA